MNTISMQIGDKFGLLAVVEIVKGKGNEYGYVLCKCKCGSIVKTTKSLLKRGLAVSCGGPGCKNSKRINPSRKDNRYLLWQGMLDRCSKTKHKDYPNYGARGINVCSQWHDFSVFCNDMGPRPSNTTLDRIDNNGNYCKENCRWATPVQQSNNRRSSVYISYEGVTHTIAEWSRIRKINLTTLFYRLKAGKSPQEILAKKDYRNG